MINEKNYNLIKTRENKLVLGFSIFKKNFIKNLYYVPEEQNGQIHIDMFD